MLLDDLRAGNLLRACEALSQAWHTDPSYSESSRIVLAHGIKLWAGRGSKYGRTRLPALAHIFQIVFCIAFFLGGTWGEERSVKVGRGGAGSNGEETRARVVGGSRGGTLRDDEEEGECSLLQIKGRRCQHRSGRQGEVVLVRG